MLWQVRYASLTEAVRLLGCFDAVTDIQPTSAVLADLKPPSEDTVFSRLFHELALLVVTGLFSYWTIIHTHTHTQMQTSWQCRQWDDGTQAGWSSPSLRPCAKCRHVVPWGHWTFLHHLFLHHHAHDGVWTVMSYFLEMSYEIWTSYPC